MQSQLECMFVASITQRAYPWNSMCLKGAPWLLVLAVTAARARTWSCICPGSTMSLKSFFTASLVLPPLARRCHSQRREVSRTRLGVPSHLHRTSAGPLLQLADYLFKPIFFPVANTCMCTPLHCIVLHYHALLGTAHWRRTTLRYTYP